MSKRLEILQRSLKRKNDLIDQKIGSHFDSVRSANGQPLNDKRNGRATMTAWDKQNQAIRSIADGIEKTKAAIEREQAAIDRVESVAGALPEPIKREIAAGLLTQWRKHPRTFFVAGVEKARIVLLDDGRLAHRYAASITDEDQRRTFARAFNTLSKEVEVVYS